ncbi:MAG: DUF3137 domain-containing protein [Marmoricola sp.]
MVAVVFIGFLALVVLVGVLGYLQQKRRREAFAALAAARGWTYTRRDDAWVGRFGGRPFGAGHGRRAENVLSGDHDGRPFAAFDYSYRTTETTTDAQGHASTHERTHRFSVTAVQVGGDVPGLHVAPEGFLSRAVGRLTNSDIEIESEDFNRAFRVTCSDRKFASDVLHPRLVETLLAGHRDLDWRFDGGWLLTVDGGAHAVDAVEPRLQALDLILDSLPRFVREDFGLPPQATPTP